MPTIAAPDTLLVDRISHFPATPRSRAAPLLRIYHHSKEPRNEPATMVLPAASWLTDSARPSAAKIAAKDRIVAGFARVRTNADEKAPIEANRDGPFSCTSSKTGLSAFDNMIRIPRATKNAPPIMRNQALSATSMVVAVPRPKAATMLYAASAVAAPNPVMKPTRNPW